MLIYMYKNLHYVIFTVIFYNSIIKISDMRRLVLLLLMLVLLHVEAEDHPVFVFALVVPAAMELFGYRGVTHWLGIKQTYSTGVPP